MLKYHFWYGLYDYIDIENSFGEDERFAYTYVRMRMMDGLRHSCGKRKSSVVAAPTAREKYFLLDCARFESFVTKAFGKNVRLLHLQESV